MALTIYNVGTVSVSNGGTTVTGVGTAWAGKVYEGELFWDPAQGIFARVTADALSNTSLTITPWAGTSMSGDAYEVLLMPDSVRSSERARQLLEQLSVVQANGRGLFYRFSTTTTDSDPGAGTLRLNNADPSLATALYIDDLDANGATATGEITAWDDSTSTTRGRLWLRSIADPSSFRVYRVTGSVVNGTGYRKVTLVHFGGSGSFANADELMVFFAPTGDTGDGYITDARVANTAALTALEGEAAGYRVFVTDLGTDFGAYTGRSGVVELIAGPDWELVAIYTGPQGIQGVQGDKGWSPQLVAVLDGSRRVLKLNGYVGGAGTAPTSNVGQYLKSDGTFTSTIGDALDFRGAPGANGAGTVADVIGGTGIVVDDTDPTQPEVSIASLFGDLHNLLINPLGTINQRGYVSGAATTGANQYTVDRWRVIVSGQSLSWTETAGVRTFTAPADGVEEIIEGGSVVGGDYVLNWEGTATATVNGTARAKGEVFTLTGGSNVSIKLFAGTYSKPQLERGSKPTPFTWRHPQQELALCRWYYRPIPYPPLQGLIGGDTRAYVSMPIQPMRTTPTVSFTGTLNIQDGSAIGDLNSIFSDTSDRDTIRLALTLNVALTLYRPAQTYSTGDPVMILNAELT